VAWPPLRTRAGGGAIDRKAILAEESGRGARRGWGACGPRWRNRVERDAPPRGAGSEIDRRGRKPADNREGNGIGSQILAAGQDGRGCRRGLNRSARGATQTVARVRRCAAAAAGFGFACHGTAALPRLARTRERREKRQQHGQRRQPQRPPGRSSPEGEALSHGLSSAGRSLLVVRSASDDETVDFTGVEPARQLL
jgi:hypothetical protein